MSARLENARNARRAALVGGLSLAVAGCGIWPWSRSRPKLPELPPVSGERPIRVAWAHSIADAGLGFQPFVLDDTVYAAGRRGSVVALDAGSGRPRWRAELEQPLICGVGSDGHTTVVGARNGTLIALDESGRQKWAVISGAEVVSVPAVGLGLAIVRTSDNRVSAHDLETGVRRWSFDRQGPPLVLRHTNSVAMDGASVYVGLPGGRLVALALGNGALRWESAVGIPRGSNEIERMADVVGSPLLIGREVCAASWQSRIACFDTGNGRPTWAQELSVASGIDIGATMVVVTDSDGAVQAFGRDGSRQWTQSGLRRRLPSTPLLDGDGVFVGDAQGNLHRLAREDGRFIGRIATDGTALASAAVAWQGLAIAQTTGGSVYAVTAD